MPGLVQFDSRSDAGFGCFTAVCTNALRWIPSRSRMPRAPRLHASHGLGLLVSYRPLAHVSKIVQVPKSSKRGRNRPRGAPA